MINGIGIKELVKHVDERGFFVELFRQDWEEILHKDKILQYNYSYSYPGVIRAWHRHIRGQVDYFLCIEGSIKICAYDDDRESNTYGELDEIVLSDERLRVARIPGKYWHGFKAIGTKPVRLIYGVNRLYDYTNPDEERRPWNDQTIIPTTINGKKDDSRVGKPWDWNYPLHR